MKKILSKGLVHNIDEEHKILTIALTDKIITLTANESRLWQESSWKPLEITSDIEKKYIAMEFIINSLILKGAAVEFITKIEKIENDCDFFLLSKLVIKSLPIDFKTKIKSNYKLKAISDKISKSVLTSFDKKIYDYIVDYAGELSLSDIIFLVDNKSFDNFISGYEDGYINLARESKSSNKVVKSIMKLLQYKMIYVI